MNKLIKKIASISVILLSVASLVGAANVPQNPNDIKVPNMTVSEAVETIVNLIFAGMVFAAIVVIAWSGYDMVISQGDPGKIKTAKDQISWAITGIIVTIFAFIIIKLVLGRFNINY